MIKLTKRERILLSVLLLLVTFGAGIMIWIVPLQAEISALEAEKTNLEVRKQEMVSSIDRKDSLLSNIESLIENVEELLAQLSTPLQRETFDGTVQTLALNSGVDIMSLSYGGIETVSPSTTESTANTYENNLRDLLESLKGPTNDDSKHLETDSQIFKQQVSINVEGSYDSIQDFLGMLSDIGRTYIVKSVNYSRSSSSDLNVVETAQITMDIYFLPQQSDSQ